MTGAANTAFALDGCTMPVINVIKSDVVHGSLVAPLRSGPFASRCVSSGCLYG